MELYQWECKGISAALSTLLLCPSSYQEGLTFLKHKEGLESWTSEGSGIKLCSMPPEIAI